MNDITKFVKDMMDNIHLAGPASLDCDSVDLDPTVEGDTKASFTMSKEVNVAIPGKRGPGSRVPVGRVTYKVTIERSYESFTDDEG